MLRLVSLIILFMSINNFDTKSLHLIKNHYAMYEHTLTKAAQIINIAANTLLLKSKYNVKLCSLKTQLNVFIRALSAHTFLYYFIYIFIINTNHLIVYQMLLLSYINKFLHLYGCRLRMGLRPVVSSLGVTCVLLKVNSFTIINIDLDLLCCVYFQVVCPGAVLTPGNVIS